MMAGVTWSHPGRRAGQATPDERKLVTILFADVTGSTALGEEIDPEDVRALMGRYYDHARQVVSDHGGTLEKFIGDAVVVVFGLPQAHGDDAERAVAAALALREAVDKDTVLRDQVTLRIGINTGEVVATSDPSSGDFLVTGDAMNVAARLLEESLERLDPDEGWRVATGRCLPYGQALTYWPLRGLLTDLVGGIERDRVIDSFVTGGYSPEDTARLADLVLAPLGIESENVTERESIFSAWRLLIETLAKDAPRIIVFEDLHWASDSLLDLVEHVMHPRTKAPLLMIAISRPELLDRRPTWGGGG